MKVRSKVVGWQLKSEIRGQRLKIRWEVANWRLRSEVKSQSLEFRVKNKIIYR